MGQMIEVKAVSFGDVAIFDTDRSITGQDGHDYDSAEEAAAGDTFPAALAARLFEELSAVIHVHLLFNEVVVRRGEPWDDASLEAASEVIRTFFIYYEQNKVPGAEAAVGPSEEALEEA